MVWFFKLCRDACRVAFLIWFDIRFEGRENIPSDNNRYIVASNHVSYIDPVMLALAIRPMICFVAKGELYQGRWGWFFRWLGTIPVERGTGDFSIAERCAERLEEGYPLGIFPEGTRRKDGVPGRAKSGLALIARQTESDVLPCAVTYSGKSFRSRVVVRYGKLIPYAELGIEDDAPRSLKQATKLIWGSVLALLGVRDDG